MKKEYGVKHNEMVIDKPYNERIKVKKINKPLVFCLAIIPAILALWHLVFGGGHIGLMIAVVYLTFMTDMIVVQTIQEAFLNKRVFAFPILFSLVLGMITIVFWLFYLNVFKDGLDAGGILCIVLTAVVGIGIMAGYILFCFVRTVKREQNACTLRIGAVCIGNEASVVNRFVDNAARERIERNTSVAYGDDDMITIYTPVFRFELNGATYQSKPNLASNKKYEEGKEYQIFVNPKNPAEIRL